MNEGGTSGNKGGRRSFMTSRAWIVASVYAGFATLWIYWSDVALELLVSNPQLLVKWSMFKGLGFVAVTSVLLLLLMRQAFGMIEQGYVSLKAKEAERQLHELEMERMNRLYSALTEVNQAIVRTPEKDELLKKVCQVLVEYGKFHMAWIGWHVPDSRRLIPVAVWGDGDGCLDGIRVHADDTADGRGPSGTAFRENRSYICNDILEDEGTLPWREELVRRGVRATAAFPIRMKDTPLGTLTVDADEADFFQDKEVALLEEAALDISFALGNIGRAEEHRRSEAAYRLSEERYRTTLEGMMEGCQLIGFDWRYLYLNGAAASHNRRPNSELLGNKITDVWPGIEESEAFTLLRRCMEGRVSHHRETEFVFADGTSGWFDVRCQPIPEGIFILSIDITERKVAEVSLRDSEERFRQLAENLNEVFWLTNPAKNEMLHVSPAYEKIWGRSCEALYQRPLEWVDAIHEEDQERVLHAAMTRQMTGDYDEIYRIVRPDGAHRWIHDRAFPIKNEKGEIYRVAGTAEDITESKLAALELARSNRALRMLSECCEALTRGTDESRLLTDICRLAVETGGYCMAWVGYAVDDEERSVCPMAHAGEEGGYLKEIKMSWAENDPLNQGPAGRTIRGGQPVICEDIHLDSVIFNWRKEASKHGYRSVICLPLRDETRTFGLLALHSGEVNQAGADEIKLLQELADDLAFGIGNIRSQTEARRIQSAIQKVAASVSASADNCFFIQLGVNMAEALGARAGIIARLVPGDSQKARTIAAVVDGNAVGNFEYLLEETPCELLLGSDDACVVTDLKRRIFPSLSELAAMEFQAYVGQRLVNSSGEMVGLICVFYSEKLRNAEFVSSTLRIFATRAAAELERLDADARIHEQASLLDKAQDAIIVRDLDQRILYWNRSAERLYGWTAEEVTGTFINELLYHDASPFLAATRVTEEQGEWLGEIEQLTKDGSTKVVEGRWSLVHDEMGMPKSILAINTDITERKQLEQQFLRAQRMESIGTLAGGIAHDLNNVLTPIMMSIDLLRGYVSNPNGLEILSMVGTSARRGAEMVSQVLTFARGVEGRSVDVRLSEVVMDLVRLIGETFPKDIHVETRLAPDLWFVRGDATQIHQVLLNLCVNSRDAMPDGGRITITAKNLMIDEQYAGMNIEASVGPYLKIEVADTGHGITREVMDRLFDPFFTTKEVGKGTGLGLSTSLAIIKGHGGFIRAYSEPGMGARFRIYLPGETKMNCLASAQIEPAIPRGRGETILVVDDEASIRQITKQTLEAFGYQVLLASDGSEAVSLYTTHRDGIAMVLTDMMMPVMDGPATIQAMRRINPSLKIIGASGVSANGKVAKAMNAGLNNFLPKPYTAEILLQAIHAILCD
ncbi:MAG: PAS domain S-box protein [Luteolibacter sp.]